MRPCLLIAERVTKYAARKSGKPSLQRDIHKNNEMASGNDEDEVGHMMGQISEILWAETRGCRKRSAERTSFEHVIHIIGPLEAGERASF